MTRFLEAWKAPFAMEGSEMLARRKRVRERGTWSVLELDSRPERVLEQGSPKVRCINNHKVSIQQLTVFLGLVSFNPLGSSPLRNLYIPLKTAKNQEACASRLAQRAKHNQS